MKKIGLILGFLFLMMVLFLGAARLGVGYLVTTDAVRSSVNAVLERSVHAVLPTLMTETKALELTGIADLELVQVRILNNKKLDASLLLERTRISPVWASLFTGNIWEFHATTLVEGDGRLNLRARVPRSFFFGEHAPAQPEPGRIQVNGSLTHIDAVKLVSLLFSDQAAPGFYLSKGLISAAIDLTEPFGAPRQDHLRVGRLIGTLEAPEWTLAEEDHRQLPSEPIALNLELNRGKVLIRKPVVVTGRSGQGTITGALILPQQSLDEEGWSLVVSVTDDAGLSKSLSKLFKCKAAPTSPRFAIKGPVSATNCPQAF